MTNKPIPNEITDHGLFCCWRYEERNGKQTKVPYNPRTGERAKSNDPQSFTDYLTASCANHQYDGMGLGIFNGICAIDLDHCIDADGNYSQTAAEIIAMMHSYTELSPSGTGVHILFRTEGFRYDTNRYYIMNRQAGIEVYVVGATNKYVTITGQPCTAYEFGERSNELQQVLERFMVRSQTGEGRATPDERQPMLTLAERSQRSPLGRVMADTGNAINAVNSPLTTDQLLEKAFNSRRGDAIRRLWSGDITGYPSQSEADQALCSHLAFWTGRDASMMDTMFRQSGLMRDKWDRKQAGSTYGQITIQTAIRNCTEVYTPKGQRQAQPVHAPSPVVQPEEPKFLPVKPLTPQSSELPPFPVECLPEPLRSYVSAVAEHSQTSPDMAAVIGLGTLAVCLQGKYRVEGSPGYYEPLSLYTVVIAPPGERKSSVMNDMTRALRDYADEYNRSLAADIKANRRERESLQRQINAQQKKLEQSGKWEDEAQLNVLNDQLEHILFCLLKTTVLCHFCMLSRIHTRALWF